MWTIKVYCKVFWTVNLLHLGERERKEWLPVSVAWVVPLFLVACECRFCRCWLRPMRRGHGPHIASISRRFWEAEKGCVSLNHMLGCFGFNRKWKGRVSACGGVRRLRTSRCVLRGSDARAASPMPSIGLFFGLRVCWFFLLIGLVFGWLDGVVSGGRLPKIVCQHLLTGKVCRCTCSGGGRSYCGGKGFILSI